MPLYVNGLQSIAASASHDRDASGLRVHRDAVVDAADGQSLIALADVGRIACFRPDTLPPAFTPELMVKRHDAQKDDLFIFTNAVQASCRTSKVDIETGFAKPLKHWAVEDCRRVIDPVLFDEQIHAA